MRIRFSPFYAALLSLVAVVIAVLLYVEQRAILANRGEESRRNYISYILSDGLRQTSDDLTRMVRLYAITGDAVYRDYFDQILAIRNGETARPGVYFQIPYWDLVLATGEHQGEPGEAVPIRTLMADAGVSRFELSQLHEAEDWSNVLVELENEVMDIVAAQVEAGGGNYLLEGDALAAMQRLHGPEYHVAKERVMRPLALLAEIATDEDTSLEVISVAGETTRIVLYVLALAALLGLGTLEFARRGGLSLRHRAPLVTLLSLLAIVAFAVLAQGFQGSVESLADVFGERYRSYTLSDGLRQTSDDLTRMVRLYAATGDPVYREYFDEILAIRNGDAPRPLRYFQIPYWDIVLATGRHPLEFGDATPIRTLIAARDFSDAELELLAEVEAASNELVVLENRAMEAVAATIASGDGEYDLGGPAGVALQRLHGEGYHQAKAKIMSPLVGLARSVQQRLVAERNEAREIARQNNVLFGAAIGLSLVLGLISVLLWRREPQ